MRDRVATLMVEILPEGDVTPLPVYSKAHHVQGGSRHVMSATKLRVVSNVTARAVFLLTLVPYVLFCRLTMCRRECNSLQKV